MRLNSFFYIACTFAALFFVSCSDDEEERYVEEDDQALRGIAVTSSWQDGRAGGSASRALPDYLTSNAVTTPDPIWVYVSVPDKDDFYVKKGDISDPSKEPDGGYIPYHSFYDVTNNLLLKKCPISRGDARKGGMTAYYVLDRGISTPIPVDGLPAIFNTIPAIGSTDYMSSDPTDYPVDEAYRDHLLFTLKHRTALLRLKFKVAEKYLTIRNIVLRGVKINKEKIEFIDFPVDIDGAGGKLFDGRLLTKDAEFVACAYINPEASSGYISPTDFWTFECTYDIYDKEEISAPHLTRQNVTATNRVKLQSLNPSISEIKSGYYYDLTITIDPDYLYVLSEHDNKSHLTIQ